MTGPAQYQNNCWFNVFMVCFFMSDKGRKFNNWLRETMITGMLPNKTKIKGVKFKKSLFLFNNYIETLMRYNNNRKMDDMFDLDNMELFANLDTNIIIDNIYNSIDPVYKLDKDGNNYIVKSGCNHNPLTFYTGLYYALGANYIPWNYNRYAETSNIARIGECNKFSLIKNNIQNNYIKNYKLKYIDLYRFFIEYCKLRESSFNKTLKLLNRVNIFNFNDLVNNFNNTCSKFFPPKFFKIIQDALNIITKNIENNIDEVLFITINDDSSIMMKDKPLLFTIDLPVTDFGKYTNDSVGLKKYFKRL